MAQNSQMPSYRYVAWDWQWLLGRASWVILGLAVVYSLAATIGKTEEFQDRDFGAYYRAGQAVARGESPYRVDAHGPLGTYPYAPAYAYLFLPLSLLDYLWACRLWIVLNWVVVLACIYLGLRLVLGNERRSQFSWGLVCLAVVPLAHYFWANVRVGQVGCLMVALCLGWAVCQRHGREFAGGLLLAAACALKITPILLLPYVLIRRDWRGLTGAIVGGLALFALPAPWVGLDGALGLHWEWAHHSLNTQVPAQTIRPGNQSLLSELARLPAISNGQTCYSLANLRILERHYSVAILIFAAGLYGWVLMSRQKDRGRLTPAQEQLRDNLHLAMLLIFMTLAHPRAWRCNFVSLILPCLMLADHVRRRLPGWKVALGALVIVALANLSLAAENSLHEWSWSSWFLQGKHFWGALAVAAACGWSCCRPGPFPLVGRERGSVHIVAHRLSLPNAGAPGPEVSLLSSCNPPAETPG